MTTFEKVYNRMKNRFEQLAKHKLDEKSEAGIKLKVTAEEIANIEDVLSEYQQEAIDELCGLQNTSLDEMIADLPDN